MKPALLVVDMQNEFFAPGSPALDSLRAATPHINAAIALFRKVGAPVVVVSDIEAPARVPGEALFATHESVAVRADDLQIHKRACNAFWQTPLDEELRARGVDMVFVSGFCAEFCVLGTYRGAQEREHAVALLRGGIASPHADHLRMVESICDVVSYGALAGLLGVKG